MRQQLTGHCRTAGGGLTMAHKLYQTEDEWGSTKYLIIDETDDPEFYLEYGEKIVTDCWLSDVLKCEDKDIFIPTRGE